MTAKALILAGYGLNCEEETAFAFDYNGLDAKIIHINDLIETPRELENAQILAIPGGFSYGDDTGAGNAYAQKLKLSLMDELKAFVRERLSPQKTPAYWVQVQDWPLTGSGKIRKFKLAEEFEAGPHTPMG